MEDEGCTVVVVAVGGMPVAVVGVADALRPEAPAAVAALKRMGMDVWMITGDTR